MSWVFEELLGTPTNPNKKQLGSLARYPTVHKDDQLPVNIIKPDMKNGPWIAGGACLRWFQNKPVGEHCDIDVFCKNEKQAAGLIDYIKHHLGLTKHKNGYTRVIIETKNACTFNLTADFQNWKLQIITCRYFDNIQEVIDNFDISVCQIATTGREWILGEHTAKDINQRNLRFNHITHHAPKRLIKYWTYGFTPVPGTIEAIQDNTEITWNFSLTEDYDNTL
jgi:hypothetical protein